MVSIFAAALVQYGHSKSENSTIVSRAFAGPLAGAPLIGSGTGFSRTLGAPVRRATRSECSMAYCTSWPSWTALTTIWANPRLSLHLGSLMRHSASVMLHEQRHGRFRSSVSAVFFCAGVRPERSTCGRFVVVCQSTAFGGV